MFRLGVLMNRRSDFKLSTEVSNHVISFHLTTKHIAYVRVTRFRPFHIFTGVEAIELACELVPVDNWPAYAQSLARGVESTTQEGLF